MTMNKASKLATMFLAAATALAPMTPAYAHDTHRNHNHQQQGRNNNDQAGALIGGLVLGIIIGEALNGNNHGQRPQPRYYPQQQYRPQPQIDYRRQCTLAERRLEDRKYNARRDGYITQPERRQIDAARDQVWQICGYRPR